MSRNWQLLRFLQTARVVRNQQCQPSLEQAVRSFNDVHQLVGLSSHRATWVYQQPIGRGFAAAPARALQESMEEVAERKLAEAHSRNEALQETLHGKWAWVQILRTCLQLQQ